jgi:hypothetical protein
VLHLFELRQQHRLRLRGERAAIDGLAACGKR